MTDQALERILKITSPEALEAFREWMLYKYIALGVKILAIVGLLAVVYIAIKKSAKYLQE